MTTAIGTTSFLWASGAALTCAGASSAFGSCAAAGGRDVSQFIRADEDSLAQPCPGPFFAQGPAANGETAVATPGADEILAADMNVPGNRTRLVGLLSHKNMWTRVKAADLLGRLREGLAATALHEMASADPEIVARMRAVKNLERIADEASALFLVALAVNGQPPAVRSQAESSCRFLCDTNPGLKRTIVKALTDMGSHEAKAVLNLVAR